MEKRTKSKSVNNESVRFYRETNDEKKCPECNGTGYDPLDGGQCDTCSGTGTIYRK